MSAKRVALDSNILVYSVDLDAGKKHENAIELFAQLIDASQLRPEPAIAVRIPLGRDVQEARAGRRRHGPG
jgi:predicted nucleic acid-binding protein